MTEESPLPSLPTLSGHRQTGRHPVLLYSSPGHRWAVGQSAQG